VSSQIVDMSCRWTTFLARTSLVDRGLNSQARHGSHYRNGRCNDNSRRSIAWVSRKWSDKSPRLYCTEFWCAFQHKSRLMVAKQASSARICGPSSSWRRRNTAGGRTWRDCFVVHLSPPIIIHGKIVFAWFLAEG
jgi:hypothetical protein